MANAAARPAPSIARVELSTAPMPLKSKYAPSDVTWFKSRSIKAGGRHSVRPARPADGGRNVRLFGLKIFDTTVCQAADWIVDRAIRGLGTQVSFLNAHCVNVMSRDHAYFDALDNSDRIFADGSGVGLAALAGGITLKENVNGTDLFPVLCAAAAEAGVSMFLFGGQSGVGDRAAAHMAAAYGELSIAGTHHGFIKGKEEEDRLINWINASGAEILLVGLGVPSQELWITRNRHRLSPAVIIGVGGLFDYYSGRIARAPLFIRAFGCEWLWRLAMEPRRLAKRYLLGNIEFLARLARLRIFAPASFNQQFTT
ncbi:MAG: WecB/TagA/CpsF family glycosyltransferase [Hyphomicrobiaceae bacterium]